MWADRVLEEVRAVREAHAARFGFDIRAIVEDLQRREYAGGREIVMPPVSHGAADAPAQATLHRTPVGGTIPDVAGVA